MVFADKSEMYTEPFMPAHPGHAMATDRLVSDRGGDL